MEDRIDITVLSLGVVLAALYNNTCMAHRPADALQDLGKMTEKQAENFIDTNGHLMSDDNRRIAFDYVHGRAIKVDFFEDDDGKIWLEKASLYNWESIAPADKVVEDLHRELQALS